MNNLHVGLHSWTSSLPGSFNCLWTLPESACNKLDMQLAAAGHGDGSAGGVSFSQYSAILSQRSQLDIRLQTQLSQATMLEKLSTFMALSLPDLETNPTPCAFRREASVACQLEMVIT